MAIEQPEYAVERYLKRLGDGRPEPTTLGFYAAIDAMRAVDPFVAKHVVQELADQRSNVKLIASENYSSLAVQQAMGNLLTDKYAEGYPWHRFYAGCDNVDAIEEHGAEARPRPLRREPRLPAAALGRRRQPRRVPGHPRHARREPPAGPARGQERLGAVGRAVRRSCAPS